jgi:hypothetical protein
MSVGVKKKRSHIIATGKAKAAATKGAKGKSPESFDITTINVAPRVPPKGMPAFNASQLEVAAKKGIV